MKKSDDFDIAFSFPTLHRMLDDVEQQILAPLSCLREVGSEWILEIDLPLVDKKDISISLDDNTITVEAKLREEYSDPLIYKSKFKYFKKTITLPGKADTKKITAKFERGRLVIRIPKIHLGRKIKIN